MVVMMGSRAAEKGWRKGPWTHEEDRLLSEYVSLHGKGKWSSVAKFAGLNRSGKSCRLRWVNYLKPGLKKGQLTPQEEHIIFELHAVLGNKWSTIAKYLPGRTDNEIKNYWRTHFKKKEKSSYKKQESRRAKVQKQNNQEPQMEQQPNEYGMKNNVSSNEETMNVTKLTQIQDDKLQEMALMFPTMEESYYLPLMNEESPCSWRDTAGDDSQWSSLWDLLDEPLAQGHSNQFNKYVHGKNSSTLAIHNQDRTCRFDDIFNNLCCGKYMFG